MDDKAGKEFKAIYSFDLKTKQIDLRPFLLIEMDTIKYYKNYNTMARLGIELLAYFDASKGDVSFQPSGIAIHPISGNVFILASVGNLLIVFSREGAMLAMAGRTKASELRLFRDNKEERIKREEIIAKQKEEYKYKLIIGLAIALTLSSFAALIFGFY